MNADRASVWGRPIVWGGVMGFFGVAMGAFGAHWAQARLTEEAMATFDTAVRYHLIHAVALAALGVLKGRFVRWPLFCFAGGIVLFSGSLYALALGGPRWLGMVTPMGGVLFLAGWLLLLVGGWAGGRTD